MILLLATGLVPPPLVDLVFSKPSLLSQNLDLFLWPLWRIFIQLSLQNSELRLILPLTLRLIYCRQSWKSEPTTWMRVWNNSRWFLIVKILAVAIFIEPFLHLFFPLLFLHLLYKKWWNIFLVLALVSIPWLEQAILAKSTHLISLVSDSIYLSFKLIELLCRLRQALSLSCKALREDYLLDSFVHIFSCFEQREPGIKRNYLILLEQLVSGDRSDAFCSTRRLLAVDRGNC